tara:strand:+ start:2491 stop:2682 length:192 start_codon:yes stop_codon:yes gene_type:complete
MTFLFTTVMVLGIAFLIYMALTGGTSKQVVNKEVKKPIQNPPYTPPTKGGDITPTEKPQPNKK